MLFRNTAPDAPFDGSDALFGGLLGGKTLPVHNKVVLLYSYTQFLGGIGGAIGSTIGSSSGKAIGAIGGTIGKDESFSIPFLKNVELVIKVEPSVGFKLVAEWMRWVELLVGTLEQE